MEIIIIILLIVIGILVYQFYGLNIKVEQRAREQYDYWKKTDYDNLRRQQQEIAQREARAFINQEVNKKAKEQYDKWCQQEIARITSEQQQLAKQSANLQLQQWKDNYEKQIRSDAIKGSQSVIAGKVTEHIVPYLPEFKFNPKDARFIGSPIDLIVFDGLDEDTLRDIYFIEVKTGSSTLSRRQRQIRDAVKGQRVRWIEIKKEMR